MNLQSGVKAPSLADLPVPADTVGDNDSEIPSAWVC